MAALAVVLQPLEDRRGAAQEGAHLPLLELPPGLQLVQGRLDVVSGVHIHKLLEALGPALYPRQVGRLRKRRRFPGLREPLECFTALHLLQHLAPVLQHLLLQLLRVVAAALLGTGISLLRDESISAPAFLGLRVQALDGRLRIPEKRPRLPTLEVKFIFQGLLSFPGRHHPESFLPRCALPVQAAVAAQPDPAPPAREIALASLVLVGANVQGRVRTIFVRSTHFDLALYLFGVEPAYHLRLCCTLMLEHLTLPIHFPQPVDLRGEARPTSGRRSRHLQARLGDVGNAEGGRGGCVVGQRGVRARCSQALQPLPSRSRGGPLLLVGTQRRKAQPERQRVGMHPLASGHAGADAPATNAAAPPARTGSAAATGRGGAAAAATAAAAAVALVAAALLGRRRRGGVAAME
mmetsp:Transcript_59144/g.167760  ORF Transcript_59144/g.167760 Transcript_59144/m.167760 type:complete len:408 (+) Transcript_59144:136-1359(+)